MTCHFVEIEYNVRDGGKTPLFEGNSQFGNLGHDYRLLATSKSLQKVTLTGGDIDFGDVCNVDKLGKVFISFRSGTSTVESNGKEYGVTLEHPELHQKPREAIWISPNATKPSSAWSGGGTFDDFSFGALSNCQPDPGVPASVTFTLDPANFPKGSVHAYKLATVLTDSGINKHLLRADPQIRNTGVPDRDLCRDAWCLSHVEFGAALVLAFLVGAVLTFARKKTSG